MPLEENPLRFSDVTNDSKMKAIQVNLNARSRAVVEELRNEIGIPNTEAMARLLEWYAAQDVGVRLAIMVRSTEDRATLLQDAMQRWADAEREAARARVRITGHLPATAHRDIPGTETEPPLPPDLKPTERPKAARREKR